MPVIPSRYTCPLFSPNVVAPRKALQAEASEASEVRMGPIRLLIGALKDFKTLQREDTQCNGSRDVCCYFFWGKTETKAIGSFIIPPESITNLVPGVQKRLEVMAMGHDMPWLLQTKNQPTQIGPSWAIQKSTMDMVATCLCLGLHYSSWSHLVTFFEFQGCVLLSTLIIWCCRRDEDQPCRSLLAQHHYLKIWTIWSHFTPTKHILHCSLTQDGFSDFLPFLEMPATQKTHASTFAKGMNW